MAALASKSGIMHPRGAGRLCAAPPAGLGGHAFGGGIVARAVRGARAASGQPAAARPGRAISSALRGGAAPRRLASSGSGPSRGADKAAPRESPQAGKAAKPEAADSPPGKGATTQSSGSPGAPSSAPSKASEVASAAADAAAKDAARWGPVWPLIRGWRWTKAQMTELWKRYGWLTVITWLGVYVTFLSGMFAARRAGLIKGMAAKDVEAKINSFEIKKRLYGPDHIKLSPVAMDFLIAWLLVKTTEPIRLLLVVGLVPLLVRRLPRWVLFRLGAKNIPGRTGGPGL